MVDAAVFSQIKQLTFQQARSQFTIYWPSVGLALAWNRPANRLIYRSQTKEITIKNFRIRYWEVMH